MQFGTTRSLPELILSDGVKRLTDQLKAAREVLSSIIGDDPCSSDYASFAENLCSDELLKHSSAQVRILVACCLADLFRLDSAESLLPEEKLKDLLLFCMDQLKMITKPDLPGYFDSAYLLENLSNSKIFLRLLHLDNSEELLLRLYKVLFALCLDTLDERMWNFVAEIGIDVFREVGIIPVELMQLVLGHLVHDEQRKGAKYRLASEIIQKCEDTLQSSILSAFSAAMFDTKSLTDWFAVHLYSVFVELYRANAGLAKGILPFMCQNMKSTGDAARLEAVRFYSRLLSETEFNVVADNPPLWQGFLGRFHDVSTNVRLCCVRACSILLLSRPELADDLRSALESRIVDSDETVRFEVLSVLLRIVKKDASLMTDRLLYAVKARTLDKRFKVRRQALICLSNFCKRLASGSPDGEINSKYSWIKNRILHSFYNPLVEDRLLCHKMLNTSLVSHSLPTEERARKLYNLYSGVDEMALKVLNTIFRGQAEARTLVLHIMDLYEATQNTVKQNNLLISLKRLSVVFSCSYKVTEELQKLFDFTCNDEKTKLCFRRLLSLELLKSEVDDCVTNLLSRVSECCSTATHSIARELLEWIAPVLIDRETVNFLVQLTEKSLIDSASSPHAISRHYSSRSLNLLLVLAGSFTKAFCLASTAQGVLTVLQDPLDEQDAVLALHLISIVANSFNNFPDLKSSLKEELEQRLLFRSPKQTKYIVRSLHKLYSDDEFADLFKRLYAEAFEDESTLPSSLRGIAEAVALAPQCFLAELESAVQRLQALINKDELTPDVQEDAFVSTVLAVIEFLGRMLVRLPKERSSIVDSCVQLLFSYLTLDKHWTSNLCAAEKDQLRIVAATALLKISFCEQTSHISSVLYRTLAYLLIDKSKEVREAFLSKLGKYLKAAKLSVTFLATFALAPLLNGTSNVENAKFIERVGQVFLENVQHRRDLIRRNPALQSNRRVLLGNLPEFCLCYVIYLLAYYPEFVEYNNDGILRKLKNCLWFAIKPLTDKKDGSCINVTFIEQVLVALKHSVLVEEPNNSEQNKKVWALADVTNLLLCTKLANSGNGLPISTGLPGRFFQPALPIGTNSKSYLPQSFDAELKNARTKNKRAVSDNVSIQDTLIKKRGRGRPRKVPESNRPSTDGETSKIISVDGLKLEISKADHADGASAGAKSSPPQSLSRSSSSYSLRSSKRPLPSSGPVNVPEGMEGDKHFDESREAACPSDLTVNPMRTPDKPIVVNGYSRASSKKSAKSAVQSADLRRSARLLTSVDESPRSVDRTSPCTSMQGGLFRRRMSRKLDFESDPVGPSDSASVKDSSLTILSSQNCPVEISDDGSTSTVGRKRRLNERREHLPTVTCGSRRSGRHKTSIGSSAASSDVRNRGSKQMSPVEAELENVPSSAPIATPKAPKVSISRAIPVDSTELRIGNEKWLRSSQTVRAREVQSLKKRGAKVRRKESKPKSPQELSKRVLRSSTKVSRAFVRVAK
uniref:Uncharacterized protein n=1 Tax=Trichuris muris TaxID=70415 RepID=A0A5S6QHI5_TRIMR